MNIYFHDPMKRIVFDGIQLFLLSFVLGEFSALILPNKSFPIWTKAKYQFSLNSGVFMIKEHLLLVTMVKFTNSSYGLNPTDIQKVSHVKPKRRSDASKRVSERV